MRVANRHELNRDGAHDVPTDEGTEVADEDVVLVFGNAVVHLDRQVFDERLRPGWDVLLE